VLSSVSYTLPTNCENLSLTGVTAINGVGNSLNNVLVGNAAANTLTGGTGADQFVFNTALSGTNVDTITDFSRTEGDVIALSSAVFTKLQGKTNLSSYFRLSTQKPIGGDDYLVYNNATGQLAYDVTGNGGASVVFATLINKPQDFTAAQMVVI
jgi:serralysin